MRRNPASTYMSAVVVALALLALPALAQASSYNAPSNAVNVQIGKPFTGVWPGTVYQHGNSFNHWWRLPSIIRPGDTVQVALDNRLSDETVYVCLLPAIDDFAADSWLEQCRSENYFGSGQQSRTTLTYHGPAGQGFLVTWISACCYERGQADEDSDGQYTATIERITSLVNIGLAVPPTLPTSFTLQASVIYGDNTPAADGTSAVLQWRPAAVKGTDPVPFANLIYANSVGGVETFSGAMPVAAQGHKVQLRACVAQPGGDGVLCAPSGRTQVAESACAQALDNQLIWVRVVSRLAKRVRHHRAGPAKLRLKRKLKAKRSKLAKANRSVKTFCG
jgi:hypothetical protein